MKLCLFLPGLALLFGSCIAEMESSGPPEIFISSANDTAYLNTNYVPESGMVNDNGYSRKVQISGSVNTSKPGVYYLDYDYTDVTGKKSATITKTVTVVENSASFLKSFYDVVCTCTITGSGNTSTTTTHNYTAAISSYTPNNHFDLNLFYVGSEYITHWTSVEGNKINIHFFSPDYDYKSSASGTLSPSGDSFTIESTAYQFHPLVTYTCLNIYRKRNITITTEE